MLHELEACAEDLGLDMMKWQRIAGRYMTAIGPGDRWIYRRVAVVVSRQNGKTELIKPRVLLGLKLGRKMLHTAQDRARPRESTFEPLAAFFANPKMREKYKVVKIREANGQEKIICSNGGLYTIAAPRSGGARGGTYDDIIVDEVREAEDFTIDAIIRPTLIARPNGQALFFSNAGHSNSVVLNDLRDRRDTDPRLAYLEWSAPDELERTDPAAWAAGNPALGTTIEEETLAEYASSMQPEIFDTEHLCRWVLSMKERLVRPEDWMAQEHGSLPRPARPVMAIKMDITGQRAGAVVSWLMPDQRVGISVVADVTGNPIDVTRLGPELVKIAQKWRASTVAFDPYTDADLARHFRATQKVVGRDYASASESFARRVASRQFVVDDPEGVIAADLAHTVRHNTDRGTWIAVKADDGSSNSVAEAAVRATWLASNPVSTAPARIQWA